MSLVDLEWQVQPSGKGDKVGWPGLGSVDLGRGMPFVYRCSNRVCLIGSSNR